METRTKEISVGQWKFLFQPDNILHITRECQAELQGILRQWEKAFVPEGTWVYNTIGKPSLIVRFDLALSPDRSIRESIYEIEERPAGLGATTLTNPFFAESFKALRKKWELVFDNKICVVVSPKRQTCDDSFWAETLWKSPPLEKNGFLCLVRAEPHEETYHQLAPTSISTVKTKGDKGYGVKLGFWSRINGSLPWEKSFVLKPLQGSKTQGLHIWNPVRVAGSATRTKITSALAGGNGGFIQPFIEPERHDFLPPNYFLIRRVFFGWDLETSRWEYLGGNWNARPNLRIHGASDAIFGPVV